MKGGVRALLSSGEGVGDRWEVGGDEKDLEVL